MSLAAATAAVRQGLVRKAVVKAVVRVREAVRVAEVPGGGVEARLERGEAWAQLHEAGGDGAHRRVVLRPRLGRRQAVRLEEQVSHLDVRRAARQRALAGSGDDNVLPSAVGGRRLDERHHAAHARCVRHRAAAKLAHRAQHWTSAWRAVGGIRRRLWEAKTGRYRQTPQSN